MRIAEAFERVKAEGRESPAWPDFYRILNAYTMKQYRPRHGEVEDVCHEVWLRILRRDLIDKFQGKELQVSNYFWKVSRSVLLDITKRRSASRRNAELRPLEEGENARQPFDGYLGKEKLERLHEWISSLPFPHQAIMRLLMLGHKRGYICECLQATRGSVASMQKRLKEKAAEIVGGKMR